MGASKADHRAFQVHLFGGSNPNCRVGIEQVAVFFVSLPDDPERSGFVHSCGAKGGLRCFQTLALNGEASGFLKILHPVFELSRRATAEVKEVALKIAGDRTFEPWTITVLNDTDFKLYRAFERWMNGINNMTDNEGIANPADYQVDGFIDQLDRNGSTLKSYTYRGLFPTALAGIDLNYGTNDVIEKFNVTFHYQYFETDTTT